MFNEDFYIFVFLAWREIVKWSHPRGSAIVLGMRLVCALDLEEQKERGTQMAYLLPYFHGRNGLRLSRECLLELGDGCSNKWGGRLGGEDLWNPREIAQRVKDCCSRCSAA